MSVLYTEEAWNKSNDLNPKSLVESECLVSSLKEPSHKAILFSPIVWVWTGASVLNALGVGWMLYAQWLIILFLFHLLFSELELML